MGVDLMKKPSARELVAAIWDGSRPGSPMELADRVEAVLALHQPVFRKFTCRTSGQVCRQCNRNYPCPTVRLLNGEAKP
jgi:hypothetical protein